MGRPGTLHLLRTVWALHFAVSSEAQERSLTSWCVILPATISHLAGSVSVGVLVGSGADDNFINREFLQSINHILTPINCPRPVKAKDDSILETVTHQTVTLSLTISGNHQEHLAFSVISFPSCPVVFGLPWLSSSIASYSTFCHSHCLRPCVTPINLLGHSA